MEQMIFTVKETAEILHTNKDYVYKLISSGLLPVLKLGSYKIRKTSLEAFLEQYEGYDLSDPEKVVKI